MANSVYHSPTVLANPPVVQPISRSHPYVTPTPTPGVSTGESSPTTASAYVVPRVSTSVAAPPMDPNGLYAKPRQ